MKLSLKGRKASPHYHNEYMQEKSMPNGNFKFIALNTNFGLIESIDDYLQKSGPLKDITNSHKSGNTPKFPIKNFHDEYNQIRNLLVTTEQKGEFKNSNKSNC